jgi:hypothetical protein
MGIHVIGIIDSELGRTFNPILRVCIFFLLTLFPFNHSTPVIVFEPTESLPLGTNDCMEDSY